MALTKVDYVDGVTTIMAKNLNDIQNEVIANGTAITNQSTQIAAKADTTALTAEATAREAAISAEVTARAAAINAEAAARAAADTALTNELNDVKSALNEQIIISETQPVSENNKIWIDSDADSVQVPTLDDIAEILPTETLTNQAITTFDDGASGMPVKNLIVDIEPIQSGSGDPSPTNVRPITGRTEANVTRTGKNLLPNHWTNGYWTSAGTITPASNWRSSDRIACKPDTTYVISGSLYSGGGIDGVLFWWDKDYNYISHTSPLPSYTSPVNAKYMSFYLSASLTTNAMQVEAGTTASAFEPFGTIYEITFPNEAGTVYGGTLDVTNGILTVDRAIVDLGSLDWNDTTVGDTQYFYSVSLDNIIKDAETRRLGLVCSSYVPISDGRAFADCPDKCIYFAVLASTNVIDVIDSTYTTKQAFKTGVNGVKLVYPIKDPTAYQLDPVEVKTALGLNNVASDSGNINSITYCADIQKYIANIITSL